MAQLQYPSDRLIFLTVDPGRPRDSEKVANQQSTPGVQYGLPIAWLVTQAAVGLCVCVCVKGTPERDDRVELGFFGFACLAVVCLYYIYIEY